MKQAVMDAGPRVKEFEASCFDGNYITGDISPEYLDRIERARANPVSGNAEDSDRNQLNLKFSAVRE
jgi:amidophosphoribosyltransferase